MIFVKDKNNSQFRSMQNQFAEIANANMEYAIPMSSTPNVGSSIFPPNYHYENTHYTNNGYNQSYTDYNRYSKTYELQSSVGYTNKPYNKVSSVLCEMQYCTIDVSDVSDIDNYNELDASEKLRVEEIRQTLTDSNPFKPYIINAANTMSYEPTKTDGVSQFTSCGSDNCASIANMYVNQKGACSAHNVAVDYVPMTTDDKLHAVGDYSRMWVFYNPDTLENHRPNWTYPNTREVTNDCYDSTKAAIEAEKMYDRLDKIFKSKMTTCLQRGYSEFVCSAELNYSEVGLCGHRCCVGRDTVNMSTSDYYPETLCEHQKELDYTKYLYQQQCVDPLFLTAPSVECVEITYEQCKKVLSYNKGLY